MAHLPDHMNQQDGGGGAGQPCRGQPCRSGGRGERCRHGSGHQSGRRPVSSSDRLRPGRPACPGDTNPENNSDGHQKSQDTQHRKTARFGPDSAQSYRHGQDRRLRWSRASVTTGLRDQWCRHRRTSHRRPLRYPTRKRGRRCPRGDSGGIGRHTQERGEAVRWWRFEATARHTGKLGARSTETTPRRHGLWRVGRPGMPMWKRAVHH